ncbi:unnamed protein product [Owenia fusiformis]|uniref:Uncharacterized protein n=1 Tax=Owenia fusiformis TaxID=6347 RepID=A0A8S4NSI6_OWEFU|nr:unnamed protein product [Owenia fusiformis]
MEGKRKEGISDSKSLATKYQVLLTEKNKDGGLTELKIGMVFKILDELVPKLGIYTEVIKMIRDDVFEAAYSDHLTTSSTTTIDRIPFFTLVRRIYDERNEEADILQEQLDAVKKRLFDKQKQFEDSLDNIASLERDIETKDATISNLKQEITDKNVEIDRLEESLRNEKDAAFNMEYNLNCDLDDLKEDLTDTKGEVSFLKQYKQGYDELHYAFLDHGDDDHIRKKKKVPVVATRRAHLISNIESARKLEEQLLTVMNATIEEFESFLEQHKNGPAPVDELAPDISYSAMDEQANKADQQLAMMQGRFTKSIDDLNTELELLRQHRTMLSEQLQIMEENKPSVSKKRRENKKKLLEKQREALGSRGSIRSESVVSADIDEDEEDNANMDPFIPQERVFSKYAAMMYTSHNGAKTFHEFKDAKYCASCGEKTVLCPHKIVGADKIFVLPHNTTHIRVTRPKVKINQQLVDNALRPHPGSPDTIMEIDIPPSTADSRQGRRKDSNTAINSAIPGSAQPSIQSLPYAPSRGSLTTPMTNDSDRDLPSAGADTHMVNSFHKLWDDYKNRTELERTIPRTLSLDRTMSLVEQFYACLIWQDEYALEDEGFYSILDNLYMFMGDRYLKQDIAYLTSHDLISSIVENAGTSKTIQIFAHALVGNLDATVPRYILLMADFIDLVEWKSVEDVRAFASVVYPFASDDDLETLQMGYTSFSENKISKQLVCEYIMYIVLKYREPRFLESEGRLLHHAGRDVSVMTAAEYSDAMENILPIHNVKLRQRLYKETEAHINMEAEEGMTCEGVPVLKLSQITSYLGLLQLVPLVKENLVSKVIEARMRTQSGESRGQHQHESAQVIRDDSHLITMSTVKGLSSNLARLLRQSRAERQDS